MIPYLDSTVTLTAGNSGTSLGDVGYPTLGNLRGILGAGKRFGLLLMPARRLEDRIRELCARALYERDPQWSVTIRQLQLAIQEHALRVANANAGAVVTGKPVIVERRET